jgi:hypothetical protein
MATTTITQGTAGSYNYICPPGVTSVNFKGWGAGGGAGGVTGTKSAGGGGAGGAYVISTVGVTAGGTYPVVVGAGGTAGATNGGIGGSSWFAHTGSAVAPGGAFGSGGTANNASFGGGLGGTTGAIGTFAYMGGNGANGAGGEGTYGGGGGGGASDTGVGGNASGITGGTGASTGGGHGGNGRGSAGGVGVIGTAYGGGAGGAFSNNTTDRVGSTGGAGAVKLTYTTPLASSLTDNFNDNSIDGAKWYTSVGGETTVVESGQQIAITPAALTAGGVGDLNALSNYDLTGNAIYFQLKQIPAVTANCYTGIGISDGTNTIKLYVNNGSLIHEHTGGNVVYNATTMAWLKVAESGGNTYTYYSSDGINWTELDHVANYNTVTSVTPYLEVYEGDSVASPGAAIFDNFNIVPVVALTGTTTASITEADIVAGGKTIILTLTGDTWIAAGGASFDLQRANIIAGLTSAQSEALGWNNVVKVLQAVTGVVRTSDTVVTITLDAQATYNITATEIITATIPASALVGNVAVVATPTFSITATAGGTPFVGFKNLLGVGV